ncbi:heavy metal translocating P-type ATPase [Gallibacter intestinalis]|uniref:Cd(2+)-exporting ATPase n=1 Tax=Gallibacter intestinalis TaxID=2779356 RepID=A0ABR9QXK3_9FIRM|nr:heavy metal translocating P-type ATPase [Gallibacter intestinalis]MBE5035614.1 cadmium-translocating P-type ATPase [Gallibacter intestinalis]
MSRKLKKLLVRISIAAVLFLAGMLLPLPVYGGFETNIILLVAAYLLVGYDIILKAATNIGHGQVFDENFLMTIATFAAFGTGEIAEGVMVMLLYQVGEWFQQYAVGKSRNSISDLMDIRPDYAHLVKDGETQTVDPEDVAVGDTILIKAGEKVPLDGIVKKGESFLDTSALTGESVPRRISAGDEILSGCINGSGLLEIEVSKEFEESTVSKILDLVENASSRKAKAENFITKFAKYYTPIVVFGALVLAIIPPLAGIGPGFREWIIRACTFLVISCPCALVISVPLGFFGGIGGAAKEGILIKGSNFIETLANVDTVVFDKTGTVTKGTFEVQKIQASDGVTEDYVLECAALAESHSSHPIAGSLIAAYKNRTGKELSAEKVSDVKEFSGMGVAAVIDGVEVFAGNDKLSAPDKAAVKFANVDAAGTVVHVALKGKYLGYILISDEIKEGVAEAMTELKKNGVSDLVMLTGDRKNIAEKVASSVDIDTVYSQLMPGDKVDKVEELIAAEDKKSKGKLAFVGDGINDAPVLSRADVGIAMGGLGSDAAIEAADVVIMDDRLSKIAKAIGISRRTIRIVRQNIVFALGVKGIFLVLGALGFANLWEAVFADVGVAFIAILNSMRTLYQRG